MGERPTTPRQALEWLLDGHRRFHDGRQQYGSGIDWSRRLEVSRGQSPFAALIGCADSRVAPPIVFDAEIQDTAVRVREADDR